MNEILKHKVRRIEDKIAKLNNLVGLPYGYVEHIIPTRMVEIEQLILDLNDIHQAFRLHKLLWEDRSNA